MKFPRLLLCVQSLYTFLTAVWPLVHIKSFMEVTGYKTDVWLVKTVGALLVPVSLTLGYYFFNTKDIRPAALLGSTTAIAFISIDFYYALNDMISDIYMADGLLQIFFLLGWMYWMKADGRVAG